MSKAFTRESDGDEDDAAAELPPVAAGKNYVTPEGFAALRDEYTQLHSIERPKIVDLVSWAASNGDRSENADYHYGKKRLREIDRRLRYVGNRIKSATVVNPAEQPRKEQAFFGAHVTYADENDVRRDVYIVGIDEADITIGKVSWISPIARAVMKARVGDVAKLHTPSGVQEIEIIAISYNG
jgi:transcription elongation factor GreB